MSGTVARDVFTWLVIAWLIHSYWQDRATTYQIHGLPKGYWMLGGMISLLIVLGIITVWNP